MWTPQEIILLDPKLKTKNLTTLKGIMKGWYKARVNLHLDENMTILIGHPSMIQLVRVLKFQLGLVTKRERERAKPILAFIKADQSPWRL